ncbi:MAG TPA: hypothetical protein DCE41_22430, partial [Cytophagales bacterium]|nr:hypothetical protein [Cytophagales bacterium]
MWATRVGLQKKRGLLGEMWVFGAKYHSPTPTVLFTVTHRVVWLAITSILEEPKPKPMAESSSLNDLKQMLADELAKEQLPPSPSLDAPPASAQKTIEVEGPTLFQDSVLWQWQREFFAQAGPEAWRGGIVPHYITSSSYLAYSYAQVVLAYQQDRALAGETAPLTVMELGGGSGQFTFLFLKHYWESAAPYLPPLEYVFTDVVQANLDFVAQHPLLARPQEHGLLDVALFDISHPQPLTLQGSDTPWLTEPTDGPLLVIANYLWDTVPMELWRFQEGQAYPLQVALSLPASPGQPVDYTRLPDLVLSYTEGKPEAPLHPMLTQLLAADFEGDVLFPKIGLDCLDWLNQQVQGQLLLLSGDKPQTEGAAPHQPLQPVHHGSFSLPVNFEAFRWWAQQ